MRNLTKNILYDPNKATQNANVKKSSSLIYKSFQLSLILSVVLAVSVTRTAKMFNVFIKIQQRP